MNERHPLDIVSLVFGILFLGLSVPVLLLETRLTIDPVWAIPGTLVVIGLLVLWSALQPGRSRSVRPEASGDPAGPEGPS